VDKRPRHAAPDLGQDTEDVLAALGYAKEEIARFIERGVAVQGAR
jgi:crotonobetainyl-CoA:carnitine CoA-transferase CaiB-like acyl-CoA transferase